MEQVGHVTHQSEGIQQPDYDRDDDNDPDDLLDGAIHRDELNQVEQQADDDQSDDDADETRREHARVLLHRLDAQSRPAHEPRGKILFPLRAANREERRGDYAARSVIRTLRPNAVAILTSASSEKRSIRPRNRSLMRGWLTPHCRAASACVQRLFFTICMIWIITSERAVK